MDGILKDTRFAHIPRDPAFKRIPKQERKVKIDKRFQSMFSDHKFKVKYAVDKRGRPVRNSSTENLRRYYELDSSNESEEISSDEFDSEEKTQSNIKLKSKFNTNYSRNNEKHDNKFLKTTIEKSSKQKKKRGIENDSKESSPLKLGSSNNAQLEVNSEEEEDDKERSDSDFDGDGNDKLDREYKSFSEKVRTRLQDMTVDYARGEGVILSDSSSDEESSDNEVDEEDEEDTIGWGQMDHDAERTDDSTNRLAVCNMDWDRITAKDLLVLLHSFVPKGGLIHSVTIYPSEFGLERMQEEEKKGPLELIAEGSSIAADSESDEDEKKMKKKVQRDDEEVEEGSEYQREKLRQYQLKRLRYYYAVVVCDSVATADALYKECDGMEYESSASHLDLRFIPDGTTFDQEPKETCTELPNMTKYEPQHFVTTALQQSKVKLTWDETDPRRSKINDKINAGKVDEVDDNDLKAYLATSSSEGESSEEEEEEKKESASKYRALLESIESQETAKKEKNMEMEVTWGINLKEQVKKRLKDGKTEEMTPFQKYLERRKEKKKAKREEQLKKKKQQQESRESADEDSASEENSASEDDVPSDIDMNDEYFKEEFQKEEFALSEKTKSKKKKNKKKKDNHEHDDEESKRKKAELELLLMDEEDNRKHFSLKDILIEDSESKKKKKKKKNKKKLEEENAEKKVDDFQMNLQDNRFSALFTSHLYNIDPADPHYKKTKGMEALRQEKLNRRSQNEELPRKKQKIETSEKKKNAELALLVKNVKRKTQTLKK